jgi:hypothetical protein
MVKASTDSKPVPKKIPNQGNKKTQAKTGSLQRPKGIRFIDKLQIKILYRKYDLLVLGLVCERDT